MDGTGNVARCTRRRKPRLGAGWQVTVARENGYLRFRLAWGRSWEVSYELAAEEWPAHPTEQHAALVQVILAGERPPERLETVWDLAEVLRQAAVARGIG